MLSVDSRGFPLTPTVTCRRLLVPDLMEYRPRSQVEEDPDLQADHPVCGVPIWGKGLLLHEG